MNIQTAPLRAEILTPAGFFRGDMEFSGFVQDPMGKVRRHYHGTVACRQADGVLTLDEMLYFNDGAAEERVWTIDGNSPQITGHANDLVGDAIIKPVSADEMHWHYAMMVDIGRKRRAFDFFDVFVQTKDNTMIAKTTMKKFGIPLARLYSSYRLV